MAVTRIDYTDLNDAEIDAESPLTESVMFRLRDNWFTSLCNPDGITAGTTTNRRVRCPERLKTEIAIPSNKILVSDGLGGFVLDDKPSTAPVAGGSVIVTASGAKVASTTLIINLTDIGKTNKSATIFYAAVLTAASGTAEENAHTINISKDASNNYRMLATWEDSSIGAFLFKTPASGTGSISALGKISNLDVDVSVTRVNDNRVDVLVDWSSGSITVDIQLTAIVH